MIKSNASSLVLNTLRLKHPKLVLLESCSSLAHLKIIHAHIIRTLLISDVFVVSRLLALCIDSTLNKTTGVLDYAFRVSSQIQNPNLFVYNALIRGSATSENPNLAFHFYRKLLKSDFVPDNITFPFLLKACAKSEALRMGIQTHCQIVRFGLESDVYVENSLVYMYANCGDIMAASNIFMKMKARDVVSWTAMIAGYCKCGEVENAQKLFDKMPERNLVTWSVMINGYVKNNHFDKAIELFEALKGEGLRANETVMVSVISSYASMGALELGEKAHDYVVKNHLNMNVILGTALVHMYSRCGNIEKAIRVFEDLDEKDSLSWTAAISGLAMHGYAEEAIDYFTKMVTSGFTPRDITFTAVLSACSHGGLVDKGLEIFRGMKKDYRIEPRLEHYGCVVDLLGRAGKLTEAERFVLQMPVKPNAPIWGALLGACRIHKNAEIAERAGRMLIELKPEHSGYYVLLANVYARAKKWENVEDMREMMKEKHVKKPPGWSLIEIDGKIQKFTMGEETHPERESIWRMWEEILGKIRSVGYKGNTADAFYDIDEEEKESALHRHSEKLAIAYGILKTKPYTTIRIVKNLRVCEDCHTATKLISEVYDREFIVRDSKRFHHFRKGACSCKDYW